MFYDVYESPFCEVILVGNENGLAHLHLKTGEGKREFKIDDKWEKNPAFFKDVKTQLEQYFQSERKSFDVKLNLKGTDFQRKVWGELCKIPYGEVSSYGKVAAAVGNKNASRAVGMANSKNPVPIIVPCHRVVGVKGNLTGFAHGLDIKHKLLQHEKTMSVI